MQTKLIKTLLVSVFFGCLINTAGASIGPGHVTDAVKVASMPGHVTVA